MAGWKQGDYIVKNREKYNGEKNPRYKSNLEERMMWYLDNNQNVIGWGYEKNTIYYKKPIFVNWKLHHVEDHRYIIDYWCEVKNKDDGKVTKFLIEVKSHEHTKPPVRPKKMTQKAQRRYMHDCMTYAINQNKWMFAKEYAKTKGWNFVIITDKDLL